MSTFEAEDVSEDIRSSVSNGFSSSKVSMVALGVAYAAHGVVMMGTCVLRRQGLSVRLPL
jgi:hypothetical protein